MGLLRRVETRLQGGFERAFGRGSSAGVQPAEIARKLVKEMDDHKTDSLSRVYVPNHFTVYLCADDRTRFRDYEGSLVDEFESHIAQHVRREGLSLVGPPRVAITGDADLRPGQFGILAELVQAPGPRAVEGPAATPGGRTAVAPVAVSPSPPRPSESIGEGATPPPALRPVPADTQTIPRDVADHLGLARQIVLLRHGSHVQEFDKGRVVLGRSRDADFRLNDPNVSRKHAVIYWENGRVFVKDLGSTNGTLLNGRPVTSSSLEDGDIITIGECTVVVETE